MLARVVIDAALERSRNLGAAFVESGYENALCNELSLRRVSFERQVVVPIRYKGVLVGEGRADLVVGGLVVVQLKALPARWRRCTSHRPSPTSKPCTWASAC